VMLSVIPWRPDKPVRASDDHRTTTIEPGAKPSEKSELAFSSL